MSESLFDMPMDAFDLSTDEQPRPEPINFRHWVARDSDPDGLTVVLRAEHVAIAEQIARLTVNDLADDRTALWNDLVANLTAHADASCEVVFEPLASKRTLRIGANRAMTDVTDILDLLEEMNGANTWSARFAAQLDKLAYLVEQHRADVESSLLPRAAAALGPRLLHDMRGDFLRRKQHVTDRLSA